MNANDIYNSISRNREYKRSSAWDAAFVLYNQNHERKLRAGCMKCAKAVRDWLKGYVS